jgi:hypothetical protein
VERAQTLDLAGGRGFFEHNWDWGDIQFGFGGGWAVTEMDWLIRGGGGGDASERRNSDE